MKQHDAASAIAKALADDEFTSVHTLTPLKGRKRSTIVLASLGEARLSVTVEILAQP